MSLSVHVLGREVATLTAIGDFKSSMTYHDGVAPDDFVSLTMRVRGDPYIWDDVLHPVFQMNLPECYLLQVLQEQFGPNVGASPTALLSVIGRNMIGRVQVAPAGASLDEPPRRSMSRNSCTTGLLTDTICAYSISSKSELPRRSRRHHGVSPQPWTNGVV